MENENYMQTKLYDSFSSSQLSGVWKLSSHELRQDKYDTDLFIWVDSSATVSQSSGDLKLSMLHYPNYTTFAHDWENDTTYPITANFLQVRLK